MKALTTLLSVLSIIFLASCTNNLSSQVNTVSAEIKTSKPPLIIIGEGGPSGSMFQKAADTYAQENKGERYTVQSGDAFIAAMRDYIQKHWPIQHLEYFWHGNSVGLYINQAPNINGALYANDPRVNTDYLAASIYELPRDVFEIWGSVRFNGCNVAEWHLENKSNLAQNFMNYFHISGEAPLWPTEFSQVPDRIKPYYNSNSLGTDFHGPVYLVPTDPERGFINIKPQIPFRNYTNIYNETLLADSVTVLENMGWKPEIMGWTYSMEPWKNTTHQELFALCQFFAPTSPACEEIKQYPQDDMARNLTILSTLIDAAGLPITNKKTQPWYQKYISYWMTHNLLTDNFINKKWYTRAELIELAGKIQKFKNTL